MKEKELAHTLYDIYRPLGDRFWYELTTEAQNDWRRLALYVETMNYEPLSDTERAQVRSHIEAAYKNSGLEFDSLRRIGDLVEADTDLLGG